ncbi:hypothetical protein E6H35_02780 [Candidatus Bathyarchaeota archaeon]|nr:MAG: hypothetical protein E6H35_02780 [Candidatus Bathyarchaeota archaeon]
MSESQPPPYPYYPSQSQPHNHDKYVAGIIIGVVVTAIVAGGIGFGLGNLAKPVGTSPLSQQSFTYAHGVVDIGRSGTPVAIYFDNQVTGTLSSTVGGSAHKYQLYLPTGDSYQVTIYWYESSGYSTTLQSCAARPQPFTPTGSDYAQDFLC